MLYDHPPSTLAGAYRCLSKQHQQCLLSQTEEAKKNYRANYFIQKVSTVSHMEKSWREFSPRNHIPTDVVVTLGKEQGRNTWGSSILVQHSVESDVFPPKHLFKPLKADLHWYTAANNCAKAAQYWKKLTLRSFVSAIYISIWKETGNVTRYRTCSVIFMYRYTVNHHFVWYF